MQAQRKEEVRRLRAEGLTFKDIAAKLGIGKTTAYRWSDPAKEAVERQRALRWKHQNQERRRAYNRLRHEATKHPCPQCGHMLSRDSTGEICPGCTERRREQMVEWWREGLTLTEMGRRLGWSKDYVSVEMVRMREQGYDLPYRRTPEQRERIRRKSAEGRRAA